LSAAGRARWRSRRFQLADALGLAERGWFIPYRYRAESPPPRHQVARFR